MLGHERKLPFFLRAAHIAFDSVCGKVAMTLFCTRLHVKAKFRPRLVFILLSSCPLTLGPLDIPSHLAIIRQRKLPILQFPLPILDFLNHLHLAFRHDLIELLQLLKVFQNFDAVLVQWSGFGIESV